MQEIETNIFIEESEISSLREKLLSLNSVEHHGRRLYRRKVYDFPGLSLDKNYSWVRVRDEGDKVTTAFKSKQKDAIGGIKESEVIVSDFNSMCKIYEGIGMIVKGEQENMREDFIFDNGVSVGVQEWPWLKPYIEIEGNSEKDVKEFCEKIGLDFDSGIFDGSAMYLNHYDLEDNYENRNKINTIPIRFDLPKPDFLN